MIKPITILCKLGRGKWQMGRGGVQRKMIEILPIGEKERGEREEKEAEATTCLARVREAARP